MSDTLPVFKSHYSIGKSILTLEKETDEDGPDSIFSILKENNLKKLVLVEDSISGFLQAYSNAKEQGVDLIFGLRITVCENIADKTEESLLKQSKCIIFAKNVEGYKRLIKISSLASTEGFYYYPRIDFKSLKKLWNRDEVLMVVPFYDSFLFYNSLTLSICVPDFSFCEPIFLSENNNLPFDNLLNRRLSEFCKEKYKIQKAKSIYYREKKDFLSYLTFRCISKRSTLSKPELNHMCSNQFSFESWKESQNG